MISNQDVKAFKTSYCADENPNVAKLIGSELRDWIVEPLLDVGCGLGDISLNALPSKRVVLLDKLDFAKEPTASGHIRRTVDFWDYAPPIEEAPKTLLFSHVLQFLDEDPERFRQKLRQLDPQRIVVVINRDVGILDKVVRWADEHLPSPNPERESSHLFVDYDADREWQFEAHLVCPDFSTLTEQVMYLLDVRLAADDRRGLESFLRSLLPAPEFAISQKINTYTRRAK